MRKCQECGKHLPKCARHNRKYCYGGGCRESHARKKRRGKKREKVTTGVLPKSTPRQQENYFVWGDVEPGIRGAVSLLREYGFQTFPSCEGDKDHVFPYPVVRFGASSDKEARKALSLAVENGLPVRELRKICQIFIAGYAETHPVFYELVFFDKCP